MFWDCSGSALVESRRFSRCLERLDHPLVGVVRFVREQRFRLHSGHQRIRSGEVVDLPGGQDAFANRLVFSGFF